MPKFKVIISDPETGKSKALEMEETRSALLIGRRLGEVIDGSSFGMSGYKLQIAGGSDKDGFPMRPDIHGGVRVNVIVGEGIGFRPSMREERKRKALRGNVITEDTIQVNIKIVEKPKKAEKEMKKEKEDAEEKPQAT